MGESGKLPFLAPASAEPVSGRRSRHDMGRNEARIIVVGTVVGGVLSVLVLLVVRSMLDTTAEPTQQFLLGMAGLFLVGVVLEIVRIRVRRRSGVRVRSRSLRDEISLLRDASAASGWPARAVEVVLLLVSVAPIAVFVVTMLPWILGSWD